MSGPSWVERYGPWAVVTGASDGIGRAAAAELARRGLGLVLVARRGDRLHQLAAALATEHGGASRVVVADLAQREGRAAVLDACAPLPVGLLVAAAGFGSSGPWLDAVLDDELQMLEVNCAAVLELASHFGRRFAAQRRGGLVLLSSVLAFQGVPRSAHYAATKAWVQTLAEGLHAELQPLGVDVLASAPGPVDTGFAQRARLKMGRALEPELVARATLDALGRRLTVRPGWLSKLLGGSLAMLPRFARTRVLAGVMRTMTAHQAVAAAALPLAAARDRVHAGRPPPA